MGAELAPPVPDEPPADEPCPVKGCPKPQAYPGAGGCVRHLRRAP